MLTIHPQYIKDANGDNTLVVISTKEFDALMEELEELDDIRKLDEARKNDTGERIPMEEAFRIVESNRKKD